MPRTKQTECHTAPRPNPFIKPATTPAKMSEPPPEKTHETFEEAPASPDEPQPTLATPNPPDVPAEELAAAAPVIIVPTGSSQDEGEIEVIGEVQGEEETEEAGQGDVSELTEDTSAASKKSKWK